jgi:hypothetical protein
MVRPRPSRAEGDYNDTDPATKTPSPADPLVSCAERAAIAPDNPDVKACPGLVYAIDLLMPIDLNQDAWKVSDAALSRITKPFKPSATEPVQEAHPLLQGAARNAIHRRRAARWPRTATNYGCRFDADWPSILAIFADSN